MPTPPSKAEVDPRDLQIIEGQGQGQTGSQGRCLSLRKCASTFFSVVGVIFVLFFYLQLKIAELFIEFFFIDLFILEIYAFDGPYHMVFDVKVGRSFFE